MQIEFLETFVEVARTGSVTRAAAVLFLAQPSVSGRLRALEEEIGEPLLLRSSRGVRLTDAGRALLPFAERTIRTYREGQAALDELRGVRASSLTLGASPAVSTYFLPMMLRRFSQIHPDIRLAVRTGHSEEILALVLEEQVQIGLIRRLVHPEIDVHPCYEDELILVVHAAHPFRTRPTVSLESVAREALILFDRTSSYYELTRILFINSGVVPANVLELDNIEAAKKMVELGIGVALLPRVAVEREVALGLIVPVTIADTPTVRRPIVAIRRQGLSMTGPVRAFLCLLSDFSPEPDPLRD